MDEENKYRGGGRISTSDSVLSEGTAASRESLASISDKLANMEMELDQTLRDLDKTQTRSKSPSASKRQQSSKPSVSSHIRTRSGSIDPLASSRRSGSIDPSGHNDAQTAKLREVTERMEALEKENHLLETKYDQQRKRLNLVSTSLSMTLFTGLLFIFSCFFKMCVIFIYSTTVSGEFYHH
jgi:uncharacterized phage infection (PIP) family protein YhgE